MRTIPTITLRHRLRIALEDAGHSVDYMARQLGCSRNTVGNYLSGRSKPNAATIRVWANLTNVDPVWLAGADYPQLSGAVIDLTDGPDTGSSVYPCDQDSRSLVLAGVS